MEPPGAWPLSTAVAVRGGEHKHKAGVLYGSTDMEGYLEGIVKLDGITEGIINHDDIKIISYDNLVNLDELEAAAAAELAPQLFTAEAAIQAALQQAPWLQEQRQQQRQQERKKKQEHQEHQERQRKSRNAAAAEAARQQEQQRQQPQQRAAAAKGWGRGPWPTAGGKAKTGTTGGWGRK